MNKKFTRCFIIVVFAKIMYYRHLVSSVHTDSRSPKTDEHRTRRKRWGNVSPVPVGGGGRFRCDRVRLNKLPPLLTSRPHGRPVVRKASAAEATAVPAHIDRKPRPNKLTKSLNSAKSERVKKKNVSQYRRL